MDTALFHVLWPYILQLGGVVFAGFVAKKLHTAADHSRAQAIATIAKDIAGAVYANNPTLTWVQLLQQVVNQLADQQLTNNADVLARVASTALLSVGAGPKK